MRRAAGTLHWTPPSPHPPQHSGTVPDHCDHIVPPLAPLHIGPPAVLSEPVVAAWPDGQPRSIYHELKWNEPLGLLIAVGKNKLVDMFTLA